MGCHTDRRTPTMTFRSFRAVDAAAGTETDPRLVGNGTSFTADPCAVARIGSVGTPWSEGSGRLPCETLHPWGGRRIPPDAIDHEPRARVRHSGWPSGPETVAPCLDHTAHRTPHARIGKP